MTQLPIASSRVSRTSWVLLTFLVVMGGALAIAGWSDVKTTLGLLSIEKVAILFALAALHYGVRAIRWHALVATSGVDSNIRQNLLHLLGGFAMIATPGRVGELVRLRWLKHETGVGISRLAPIAFADRAIELGSMLIVVLGMVVFSSLGTGSVWGLIIITTILTVIVCQPRILEAALLVFWRLIGRWKARLFAKLRSIVRQLNPLMRPWLMLPLLMVGAVGWISEGLAFWILLDWLEVPLPFATATAIFMVSILAGALSGLPGGLGGTEATAVTLLILQSIPLETAVLAVLVIRIATLWFAVLIGMLVFPFAELRASRLKGERDAAS